LLLDPYAKAIEGHIDWAQACFSYIWGVEDSINEEDSAPHMSKSVVISPFFDWDSDRHPRTPYSQTVIYEAHVGGLTKTHAGIPADIRGTYAALAHPVMIEHYKKLGVTAIELMPVHQFIHDSHLADRGQRNYWGYNTIGFFAPHNEYSSQGDNGQQVQEFKATVKALHEQGLEVILDVVYNHTAEGNQLGPTLSFRGIDNAAYYRLVDGDPRYYYDTTGTGNTLLMKHPHVLQLIMDSLRYWVIEMHVDGFRFDLASSLARQFHEVDRLSAFFDLVQQDPVISQVKLIAEPWDIGDNGYNVGGFPPLWTEWNGRYRDTVRDFWRGQDATLSEFACRFTGSADLYEQDGRRPFASINFVTAHDGFTMRDLVSYNNKHNDANGEGGRDGESSNSSYNWGVEGDTDDPVINAVRRQQVRNMLTTLFLSQGVPMLLHGDELGRTQQGNNNVYAQDNELAWIDWTNAAEYAELTDFVARLSALRHAHPVLRRRRHFTGHGLKGEGLVSRIINPCAVAGDAVEDLVGGLGPHVGARVLVPGVDPASDVGVEGADRAVRATLQLLGGQFAEPAFDEVEPRRAGRGEVHDEARVGQQPAFHRGRLVGRGVVEHDMNRILGRHLPVDGLQELLELDRPVPGVQRADHLA
jgi:glycogen operon protein